MNPNKYLNTQGNTQNNDLQRQLYQQPKNVSPYGSPLQPLGYPIVDQQYKMIQQKQKQEVVSQTEQQPLQDVPTYQPALQIKEKYLKTKITSINQNQQLPQNQNNDIQKVIVDEVTFNEKKNSSGNDQPIVNNNQLVNKIIDLEKLLEDYKGQCSKQCKEINSLKRINSRLMQDIEKYKDLLSQYKTPQQTSPPLQGQHQQQQQQQQQQHYHHQQLEQQLQQTHQHKHQHIQIQQNQRVQRQDLPQSLQGQTIINPEYQEMLSLQLAQKLQAKEFSVEIDNGQRQFYEFIQEAFQKPVNDPNNINPDQMTYEQLLELQDKMGHVSKGYTEEQIKNLRKEKILPYHRKVLREQCTICYSQFTLGENYCQLDCNHLYHAQCIAQWLINQKNCPICKTEVVLQ